MSIWNLVMMGMLEAASSPIERIQRYVPVQSLELDAASIPGKYSAENEEVAARAGPALSGSDLYLFADGTFIFVEWADVEAPTINDKGKWSYAHGAVTLKSDREVTWRIRHAQEFVSLRRTSKPREVMLMGTNKELSDFESMASVKDQDREFALLIHALSKLAPYDKAASESMKAKFMSESWRPKFFTLP